MITCIICSRHSDISPELKQNIGDTIGTDYELVVIDNSYNQYSIFSAFNEGVRRAKGDILCFMHEDLLYISNDWGRSVLKLFEDSSIGIVGVVGTHFLPKTPCGWYHPMLFSGGCVQTYNGSQVYQHDITHFGDKSYLEAVAVDGMWFCIPKFLFAQGLRFDDITYNGFHCYDIDICLQVLQINYKVVITSGILVEHHSYGIFNIEWVRTTKLLFTKWQHMLPLNRGIMISEEEKMLRTKFVEQVMVWLEANANREEQLMQILRSKSYRLGKMLLHPFGVYK